MKPHLVPTERKKPGSRSAKLFETSYPLPEKVLGLFEFAPESLLYEGFDEDVLRDHDIGYDIARGRVIYPIRDLYGTLAGFAGKPDHGRGGKYRVYEKELRDMGFPGYHFSNKDYLWRWDRIYDRLYGGSGGVLYLTEGYKACLWMVQHGFENTCALMGTSLSVAQQTFLERIGCTVILCLDDDEPGRKGTVRIGHKLRALRVLVARYPYRFVGVQPDALTGDELYESTNNPYTLRQWRRSNE